MNWKQIFFDFTSLIVLVAVGVGFYAAIKLDERAERSFNPRPAEAARRTPAVR